MDILKRTLPTIKDAFLVAASIFGALIVGQTMARISHIEFSPELLRDTTVVGMVAGTLLILSTVFGLVLNYYYHQDFNGIYLIILKIIFSVGVILFFGSFGIFLLKTFGYLFLANFIVSGSLTLLCFSIGYKNKQPGKLMAFLPFVATQINWLATVLLLILQF